MYPHDLLDQVLLAREVRPKTRRRDEQLVPGKTLHLTPEPREDATRFIERHLEAEHPGRAHMAVANDGTRREWNPSENAALHRGGAAEPRHHGRRVREHFGDRLGIATALEAMARLGVKSMAPRRAPDPPRRKVRALEEHPFGAFADLAVRATHDPRERHASLPVRDQQIIRIERALHAIQRDELLVGSGTSHDDPPAGKLVEIERVHRLAVLEEDEIRHIDDVRYRSYAKALKTVPKPRR